MPQRSDETKALLRLLEELHDDVHLNSREVVHTKLFRAKELVRKLAEPAMNARAIHRLYDISTPKTANWLCDAWRQPIECSWCGATEGLRMNCDGGGYIAPDYICEACFTPQDDGPCFDDLPAA